MELALQVVGLKMTGKIEDAKNVAMRIVGNAGSDGSDSNNNTNTNSGLMQLSNSPSMRNLRPLLFLRAGENSDFENRILDFLSVMDTPMGVSAPNSISTPDAISYPSPSGQTLLHLAVFLGFSSLTSFLIKHGADLDARDRNGFTPLHFAALAQSQACASILLEAGADVEVVDAHGKTPEEVASPGFFDNYSSNGGESESDEYSEDEDAELGDAEEEADIQLRQIISRRISRRSSRLNINHSVRGTPRRSVDVSRAATPPPVIEDKPKPVDIKADDDSDAADAKRAASFMEKMIQRTLAQIPATQGIIPQLPLPHLPNLPDLPAVPWGALPQIPMVFPVFVPMMPNWPSFRGTENPPGAGAPDDKIQGDDANRNMGALAIRAAQEWRATWEKWVALAVATTARQQTEELPPPVYTPRAAGDEVSTESQEVPSVASTSSAKPHPPEIRPVGYDSTPVPDQIVESFGYQPTAKQTQKLEKKRRFSSLRLSLLKLTVLVTDDRMLLLFWLPILFRESYSRNRSRVGIDCNINSVFALGFPQWGPFRLSDYQNGSSS